MKSVLCCLLAATLSFVILSPAVAVQAPERKTWDPPAQYAHAYTGHLTLFQVPQDQVVTLCRQLFEGNGSDILTTPTQKGCAWQVPGSCVVITISQDFRGVQPEDVLRHELGHCNGWPPDHPEHPKEGM